MVKEQNLETLKSIRFISGLLAVIIWIPTSILGFLYPGYYTTYYLGRLVQISLLVFIISAVAIWLIGRKR